MQLKNKYPILEDHVSASEVITPHGSELLIYDTVTGTKKYPNRATFNFLKLATGTKMFKEITEELSQQSGEPPQQIWPELAALAEKMREDGLLKISESPFEPPRTPPPSVELIRRLESVSLEITRRCNLRCRHCYSDSGAPRKDELTVGEIRALIDQLTDMGVLSITFTGGEPLLHPHLLELAEYARKKPLTVIVFTNATLITPEIAHKLKELDVYKVQVSIDGPDSETHGQFRKGEDAFEKTIQGITLLKEEGITIDAGISINKLNYKKTKQILRLIRELGIDDFKMWPITSSGRPEEKEIFVTLEEFRETVIANREFEIEELGKKEKEEYEYSKIPENCGVGFAHLSIKSDGVVTPCLNFGDDISLGNIREHSLIDIWNNSPVLNTLRSLSVFKSELCKDCELAAVCKGGCIAETYKRTGKFSCYNEYACVAFEITKDDFIYVETDSISSHLSVEIS